jgi:ACS family tartrate transporter-like MFS transporter
VGRYAKQPAADRGLMYYDDSVIEQSTVQKLLWHLLPLLCLLSMAAVLDRLSLGYAAPAIAAALHLNAAQLHRAALAFGLGGILAGLPATWLMLRYGVRRWTAGIAVAWGTIAVAQALVWSPAALTALRLLLGATEVSLVAAMVFCLRGWMPERHRAVAIGAMIAVASFTPLIAAPVSHLLLWIGRWFGITDWRWLFAVEGLPALWLGLHVPAQLPPEPPDAPWLPASERTWLATRLPQGPAEQTARFVGGLRSAAAWRLAAASAAVGLVADGLQVWLPLAMQPNGYVAPWIAAAVMGATALSGTAAAVAAGLRWRESRQWRRALVVGLLAVGGSLAAAGCIPNGIVAMVLLAVAASLLPGLLVLIWTLASGSLPGAAAAAGLGLVAVAGAFGATAAAGLEALCHDAAARCVVLAVACATTAWLVRGLQRSHPAEAAQRRPMPAQDTAARQQPRAGSAPP